MYKDITINFKNVSKRYKKTKGKYDLFIDAFGSLTSFKKKSDKQSFFALKNISFKVKRGETVGIIGNNGAGKSTILKLISKISYPNSGVIEVSGKIGAFIELGAGLHPELTGRENIYLYGSILGMKKKEVDLKFNKIVNFAEIEKFLDEPIKKYSSGMYSRLGFSVCAFCDPEILLVDEVLAVGDNNFQKKCLDKMKEFKKQGKTIIFVSHNLAAVQQLCERAIYIDNGRIIKDGNSKKIIKFYSNKKNK